ncbi:MAG: GNAT family protein [Chloroflexi bacterium]|nr:GNAT family protein [Chloroflexota bacterium]
MIYGERIRLRGVEKEDLPHFVEWMNDPEVIEGLLAFWPISSADEQRWFEHLPDREPVERPLSIDVRAGEAWQHIGSCGYQHIEWKAREGEIGISIGVKALWNQGYGTEAVKLLLKQGFETLNLNRIYLRVNATNLRAIRSYEKCGFVLEGRLRQALYQYGSFQDLLIMSVLRSEWESSNREVL